MRASPGEAPAAVGILREAAQWLAATGKPLWPVTSFEVASYREAARLQELVLGYEPEPVACMLLQTRDDMYWPHDAAGEALYLHKIAVRRRAAGHGWPQRLIAWAAAQARACGARYLRLDTAKRPKLVSLYQSHGFRLVDTAPPRSGLPEIVRLERPVEDGDERP